MKMCFSIYQCWLLAVCYSKRKLQLGLYYSMQPASPCQCVRRTQFCLRIQ